jgi:hypothetical protein
MKKIIISLLTFYILFVPGLRGEEQDNTTQKYPSIIIFNNVTACASSIIRNILQSNPALKTVPIPQAVISSISTHCSCVMDELRKVFTFEEYITNIYGENGSAWLGKNWIKYGQACQGVFLRPPNNQTPEEAPKDNLPDTNNQDEPPGTLFQG